MKFQNSNGPYSLYSYISAKMLRSTPHIITSPATIKLFNMSMHVEKIDWKSFLVHPFKRKVIILTCGRILSNFSSTSPVHSLRTSHEQPAL